MAAMTRPVVDLRYEITVGSAGASGGGGGGVVELEDCDLALALLFALGFGASGVEDVGDAFAMARTRTSVPSAELVTFHRAPH